jgi:hypothetical protein
MEEEEYYTASEALADYVVLTKKYKGKNITLTMEDEHGGRILIKNLKK